jgi:transposase
MKITVEEQKVLFEIIPTEKFDLLTKEELIILIKGEQSIRQQLQKDNDRLRALSEELKQKSLFIEEQHITIKNKLFGKSSEKSAKSSSHRESENKKKKVLLPSERYPNLAVIERDITLDTPPTCSCCQHQMSDSGMTEDSEYLTVVPAQYYIVKQRRHKYRCEKCHGDIKTAPAPSRIKEGSSYSNELIIDVALSKYCDLIPMERYASIAGRLGVKELPAQSLIESSHYLSEYVRSAYNKLKEEILQSLVLHADETPHRMLEGSNKNHWYFWGFSTKSTSYFECHNTRSGDVATELLLQSKCRFLVSDVFSGYGKSVAEVNKERSEKLEVLIYHVYCNAHARRKFKEASEVLRVLADATTEPAAKARATLEYERSLYFIKQYRKIYRLEGLAQKFPDSIEKIRLRLPKYFEKMRDRCMLDIKGYSAKSAIGKAMSYFLKNYDDFVRFINHPDVPIDNNPAERILRNPVIGRKTWYGTHSPRGAETAAILFSLVESCKLNKVNPREYFKKLVEDLQQKKPTFTPKEFADLARN